jgi:hypothetical protein
MIGLSTKLQECIVLNMGGSFPEFVSKLRHDKKDHFMIGLSTKLQERMALNTGGSFPEFVSNLIIADDAIHAHMEAKKWKAMSALSDSAPPRYQTVYHHGPTYPPRQQ